MIKLEHQYTHIVRYMGAYREYSSLVGCRLRVAILFLPPLISIYLHPLFKKLLLSISGHQSDADLPVGIFLADSFSIFTVRLRTLDMAL